MSDDDLISRKEVLEEINNYYFDTVDHTTRRVEHELKAHICELIENRPTAYNVGRVKECIDNLDGQCITRYESGVFGDYLGSDYYIKRDEVLAVIEAGGIE